MQPHTLEVKRDAGAATPAKYSLSSMNALFSMDRAFFVRSIEMILQIMILLLGFVLLVKGADWFVEGAASIARKLGIPQLIVGLTIVAMGTSMPEAAAQSALFYQYSNNRLIESLQNFRFQLVILSVHP